MIRLIQKALFKSTAAAAFVVLANGCISGPSPVEPGLSDSETPTVPRMAALAEAASGQVKAPAAATPESANPIVGIDNFSYSPAVLTIAAGQSVTWVNHDDVPHTATADDKSFNSKTLDTDDRYTQTFAKPGVYSYFCALHPHMTGKIVVK